MIARDPNTGEMRDYAKELLYPNPATRPPALSAPRSITTPPGKPFAECSPDNRARLTEIEADMGLLLAEWRGICTDTWPIVNGLVPAEE